ncbi:MAG: hypothetical protein IJW21_05420 [Clostridia bacterium]|nr:hypothetical protein [Clostridia bacterium]
MKKSDERKLAGIWFEFDEWCEGYSEDDENADVIFELSDGSRYCATFFTYKNLHTLAQRARATGENLFGTYFCAEKPVFIERMNKQTILAVIHDIMSKGETDTAFCRIDE